MQGDQHLVGKRRDPDSLRFPELFILHVPDNPDVRADLVQKPVQIFRQLVLTDTGNKTRRGMCRAKLPAAVHTFLNGFVQVLQQVIKKSEADILIFVRPDFKSSLAGDFGRLRKLLLHFGELLIRCRFRRGPVTDIPRQGSGTAHTDLGKCAGIKSRRPIFNTVKTLEHSIVESESAHVPQKTFESMFRFQFSFRIDYSLPGIGQMVVSIIGQASPFLRCVIAHLLRFVKLILQIRLNVHLIFALYLLLKT